MNSMMHNLLQKLPHTLAQTAAHTSPLYRGVCAVCALSLFEQRAAGLWKAVQ